jgi:hypothetical protein
MKVQGNQVKLKLIGIHQLPVYPDGVDLLRDNINAIKKQKLKLMLIWRLV